MQQELRPNNTNKNGKAAASCIGMWTLTRGRAFSSSSKLSSVHTSWCLVGGWLGHAQHIHKNLVNYCTSWKYQQSREDMSLQHVRAAFSCMCTRCDFVLVKCPTIHLWFMLCPAEHQTWFSFVRHNPILELTLNNTQFCNTNFVRRIFESNFVHPIWSYYLHKIAKKPVLWKLSTVDRSWNTINTSEV